MAVSFLLALGACGGGQRATKSPEGTTSTSEQPSDTSTTVAGPTVTVTPDSAAVGTSVKLSVSAFQAGENAKFEIDFPNGKKFGPGPAHVVGPDGTASTTYAITAGNPPGDYVVKATGDKSSSAEGKFTVTGGTATSTTKAPTSTTRTTAHRVTTTTRH